MSLEQPQAQGISLYSYDNDYRCHWVRFLLAEKKIKYHLILVEQGDEDVASLNPYNQLPMLVEQNLTLFHAPTICEYLDDRYRQNKLYADTPKERAEQHQFLWRFEQDWLRLADIMLRHPDSLDPQAAAYARKEFRDTLIALSPLFQHYPYFMSEQFSILDCLLAVVFIRLKDMGIELPAQHCKPLLKYCHHLFARPSFKDSMTSAEKIRYSELLMMYQV